MLKKKKSGEGSAHLPPGGGRPPSKAWQSESSLSDGGVSLAEYNRWLITEEKWNTAQDGRQMLNQMRTFRKAVAQDKLERGRARAEKARHQREKAVKKVMALQEHKRAHGHEVKAQVGNWNEQLSSQRRAWSDYGNTVKSVLISDKKQSRKQFELERAERAKQIREERELQETRREEQIARIEEHNRQQVSRIKAETAPAVTDESKRFFFTQRKAVATDVLKMEERWREERESAKNEHLQKAMDGVAAAKATRGGGREARALLVDERGAAAKELRDKRNALREKKAEEERERQRQTRERRDMVLSTKFISPDQSEKMLRHNQYKLLQTLLHDTHPGSGESSPGRPSSPSSRLSRSK